MVNKMFLDIDLVSEDFYNVLVRECKQRFVDVNKIEDTSSYTINNIKISFEVEK